MSLEQKIETLTSAIINLTSAIQNSMPGQATTNLATVAPQAQTFAPTVPPAQPQTFAPTAPQGAAAGMPTAPFGAAPQMQAQVPALPFNDPVSLGQYVMAKYQALEAKAPGSGAAIQNVLTSLGVQEMSGVRPDQYHEFYQGVEALG